MTEREGRHWMGLGEEVETSEKAPRRGVKWGMGSLCKGLGPKSTGVRLFFGELGIVDLK